MVLFNSDARTRPGRHRRFTSTSAAPGGHYNTGQLATTTCAKSPAPTLGPLRGCQRANTLTALHSLFGFAKKRALIFANPTIGLKARPSDSVLLRLTDEKIHAVEALATDPAWPTTASPWPGTARAAASSPTAPYAAGLSVTVIRTPARYSTFTAAGEHNEELLCAPEGG